MTTLPASTPDEVATWRGTIDAYVRLVDQPDSPLQRAVDNLTERLRPLLADLRVQHDWPRLHRFLPDWVTEWPARGEVTLSTDQSVALYTGRLTLRDVREDMEFTVPWEMLAKGPEALTVALTDALDEARVMAARAKAEEFASAHDRQREAIRRAVAADPTYAAEVLADMQVVAVNAEGPS